MNNIGKFLIVILSIALIGLAFYYGYTKYEDNKSLKALGEVTRKNIENESKGLPKDIGNNTLWTQAEYNNFKVKYTYVTSRELLDVNAPYYSQAIDISLKKICETLQVDINNTLTYTFNYVDSNNNPISSIVANKETCSKYIDFK